MPPRFIVFRPGAMGDLILTLPSLQLLADAIPGAEIHLVAHPAHAPLALQTPFISSVKSYDDSFFTPLFTDLPSLPPGLSSYLSSFDVAICYLSDPRGTLTHNLNAAGVRKVIVFQPAPPAGTHVSDHLKKAFEPLGVRGALRPVVIGAAPEDLSWVRSFVAAHFGLPRPRLLALHPGAGSPQKAWPLERFAAAARALHSDFGINILLLAGPADPEVSAAFASLASDLPFAAAVNLPARRLSALLSLASLYIGNDSGPTHLAAALGVPTIALFGPTDPATWAPLGREVTILWNPTECAPCSRETRSACPLARCMENISLGSVIAAANASIRASGVPKTNSAH